MQATVVYHNDNDGKCAAAIVRQLIASMEGTPRQAIFIAATYDKAPEIAERLDGAGELWILDFSFKPDDMKKLIEKYGHHLIWIDHHKTAINAAEAAGIDNVAGIRTSEQSGCELTWGYCFPKEPTPEIVMLIGDRDTWTWNMGIKTAYAHAGLSTADLAPTSEVWRALLSGNVGIPSLISNGALLLDAKDRQYENMRETLAFDAVVDGHSVRAMNSMLASSEAFGAPGWETGALPDDVDICCRFYWDGKIWTVSLYSQTVDVSVIAKARGGGGHKGAAGFTTPELPDFLRV